MPITRAKVRAGVLLFLGALLALAATADANGLRALKPGEFVVHDQTVPVDLVFIGYDRQLIDEKAILDVLPATYRPIVRYPQFYGLSGRDMGLEFRFRYRFVFKSQLFANEFSSFLKR